MKSTNNIFAITLASLSFLLTGCYTQLQATDGFTRTSQNASDTYYSWGDDSEQAVEGYNWSNESQTAKPYLANSSNIYEQYEEPLIEDGIYEDELESAGIFYKDYETEQWYRDNNAENLYWKGFDDGYNDGYRDAEDDYWTSSFYNPYRFGRRSIFFNTHFGPWRDFHFGVGNFGMWGFNNWGYNDYAFFGWNNSWNGGWNAWNGRWGGWNAGNGGWNGWNRWNGGWGVWNNRGFCNPNMIVYNDYSRNNTRNSQVRSSGIYSKNNGSNALSSTRTRSGSTVDNGIIRTGRTGTSVTKRSSNGSSTAITRNRSSASDSRYTGRTRSSSSPSGSTIIRNNRSSGSSGSSVRNTGRTRSSGNSSTVTRSRSNSNGSSTVRSTGRSNGSNSSVRSRNSNQSRSSSSSVRSSSPSRGSSSSSVRSSSSNRGSSSSSVSRSSSSRSSSSTRSSSSNSSSRSKRKN